MIRVLGGPIALVFLPVTGIWFAKVLVVVDKQGKNSIIVKLANEISIVLTILTDVPMEAALLCCSVCCLSGGTKVMDMESMNFLGL